MASGLSATRDAIVEKLDSPDMSTLQKSVMLRVAKLTDTDSAKKQMEMELSAEDGMLDVANSKRMLRWLAEAVGRGLELSGGNETPKDVSALLDLLLHHMSQLYVEVALDA